MVSAAISRFPIDGIFIAFLSLDFLYSKNSLTSIIRAFPEFWDAVRNSAGGMDLTFTESVLCPALIAEKIKNRINIMVPVFIIGSTPKNTKSHPFLSSFYLIFINSSSCRFFLAVAPLRPCAVVPFLTSVSSSHPC